MSDGLRRRFTFGKVQQEAFYGQARYLLLEGAYRSSKTTTALLKMGEAMWLNPGQQWLLARYTEEATFAQLKPAFDELWGDRVEEWLSQEGAYRVRTINPVLPAKVYV